MMEMADMVRGKTIGKAPVKDGGVRAGIYSPMYPMEGKDLEKRKKMPDEMTLGELSDAIDDDAMRMGLVIADIFKTLTQAMPALPDMELHTELMCITVNEEGISVHITNPHSGHSRGYKDSGDHYEDDYEIDMDDDEEGMIYDEF